MKIKSADCLQSAQKVSTLIIFDKFNINRLQHFIRNVLFVSNARKVFGYRCTACKVDKSGVTAKYQIDVIPSFHHCTT